MINWEQFLTGLIGAGIGGTIVGGIISHYSNKKLDQFHLVNESQFRAFSELWKSLMDLKIRGDELWEEATEKKLIDFVESLKSANEVIELNALILNEEDYKNIKNILNRFGEYRIGKIRLIDMDKGKIKAERKEFQLSSGVRGIYDERLNQVFQNENSKKEYERLLSELRLKFQDKMGIK